MDEWICCRKKRKYFDSPYRTPPEFVKTGQFCPERQKMLFFSSIFVVSCNHFRSCSPLVHFEYSDMKPARLPPDLEGLALVDACRSGDRRAQYALWERYKDRMFGVCLRYAASRQEAEDMLQEAFVQVFHSIDQYRSEGSLEGWIRRITVRTAIRQLKKQRLDVRQFEEAEWMLHTETLEVPLPSTDDEPEHLIALLQNLPPGFRAVINLYVLEERTHEEIATELGITVGTSKSQLHRAKAFLRHLIEKMHVML